MPAPAERHIAVIGGGSWGTALAIQVARAGHDIVLWDISSDHIKAMQHSRSNQQYLPGIALPERLKLSDQLETTLQSANTLLLAIPSHAVRSFLHANHSLIKPEQHIVWATKGLEEGSAKLVHQVVAEELPDCHNVAVVSGPTLPVK